MLVAVVGNIGSGKTTLTQLLSKYYKWEAYYENSDNNLYINDFYKDMQRWSFNLQVSFLAERFRKMLELRRLGKSAIIDRTIYEDAYIFAPNLHTMGLLSTRDFNTYNEIFELSNALIPPPDLMIYLRASVPTLVEQIQNRGRKYESSIRLDYLKSLNDRYEEWIMNYKLGKLLIVDVDKNNFNQNKEDLSEVINMIDAKIHGLF